VLQRRQQRKAERVMTDRPEGTMPPKFTSNRGQAKRSADYNERVKEKGIIQITVRASEEARPLFNAAAKLIRDGSKPGDAFRTVAGSKATDGSALLPGHEQQREQHGDLAEQQRQQHEDLTRALLETQRQQHAELLQALLEREDQPASNADPAQEIAALLVSIRRDWEQQRQQHGDLTRTLLETQRQQHNELIQAVTQAQGDAAGLPEVLAALGRLEALTAENERQRSGEPDLNQAFAALVVTIRRDREQQHQQHRELVQAVRDAQGQSAAALPEVLAALRRVEEARADWNSYDDEQLEGINALTEALASLDALDDLAAGLDELRAYDAEQLEGIKALAAALSSLDALDELTASLDELRDYNAQHLEAVKELASALVEKVKNLPG
jgi:hypothetical protein